MSDANKDPNGPDDPLKRGSLKTLLGGGSGATLGGWAAASEVAQDPVKATIALKEAVTSLVAPFAGMKRRENSYRRTFPDGIDDSGLHGLENDIFAHLSEIKRVRAYLPVGLMLENNTSPSMADIKTALQTIHPEMLIDSEIGQLLGGKNIGIFGKVLDECVHVDAVDIPIKDVPALLERITVDRLRPFVGIGSSLETKQKVYGAVTEQVFDEIYNGIQGDADVVRSVMQQLGKTHYVTAAETFIKTYTRKEALKDGKEDPFPEMGPLKEENDSIEVYDLGEEGGKNLFQVHIPESNIEEWLAKSFGESVASQAEIYTPYEGAAHYVQVSGAVAETLRHMAENNRTVPYKAVEVDGEEVRPGGMGRDAASFYRHEGRVSAVPHKEKTV